MSITWIKALNDRPRPESPKIDVAAPPCVDCKHWNPQWRQTQWPTGFVLEGVLLCHAETMFPDFSCFVGLRLALPLSSTE